MKSCRSTWQVRLLCEAPTTLQHWAQTTLHIGAQYLPSSSSSITNVLAFTERLYCQASDYQPLPTPAIV